MQTETIVVQKCENINIVIYMLIKFFS